MASSLVEKVGGEIEVQHESVYFLNWSAIRSVMFTYHFPPIRALFATDVRGEGQ